MTKEGGRQKWGFIFQVYGPRGIRHREYTGSGKSKEKAKKEAIKKAK